MRLIEVTVSRTVQLRSYEPVVVSVVVEATPGDVEMEVVDHAKRLIDHAIGNIRDPLLAVASSTVDDGELPF